MSHFVPTLDGGFVNADHIAVIEILNTKTGIHAGTWMIRVRTVIGWGTGGYGHTQGHLLVLGEQFPTKEDAQAWVLRHFPVGERYERIG